MRSPLSLLSGVAAAAALGACASMPDPHPPVASHADRHAITVEQASARMEIPVAAGESDLSQQSRDEIAAFASGYLRFGHGAMVMSTPSGNGAIEETSLLAHQARLALVEAGVPYAAVSGANYNASGAANAPIVLTFSRYEARAPECAPIWSQDLAHQSNNQPWESFGCATQANIAALVEDPRDLLRPRDMDARDGGRRDHVMGAYREGEQTHATRSTDERISISNVAN